MPQSLRHIAILLCLLPLGVQAQQVDLHLAESGRPFFYTHVPAHAYSAYPQNWTVVQGPDGRIFVGNYDGVLVYDGVTWDLIRTPTNTTVRSLALGDGGKIYVGLQGDFGYLAPDSRGSLAFTSLVKHVDENEREFRDVWATHVLDGGVYFQTSSRIYRWNGSSFHVWKSEEGFHTSFETGGQVYVREYGRGLLKVDGNDLKLIPGGERFEESKIYVLEALDDDELLIGTRTEGLLIYDGGDVRPLTSQADPLLEKHRLYHGSILRDGHIALGLLDGGGLVILDREGRIKAHYTEGAGLPDGWVNYVYQDAQGGLWLALNNRGIVRIDHLSHLTRFGAESGVDGVVGGLERFEEHLFVAASTGLLRLKPSIASDERARLEKVEGIHVASSVARLGSKLIVTSHDDLRVLEKGRIERIAEGTFYVTVVSQRYPVRFYAGTKSGVALFEWQDGSWKIDLDFVHLGDEVRQLVEANDGTLWVATRSNRIIRVSVSGNTNSFQEVNSERFEADRTSAIVKFQGRVYLVAGSNHVLLQKSDSRSAQTDTHIAGILSASSDSIISASSAPDGRYWRVYPDRVEITRCDVRCTTEKPLVLTYPDWNGAIHLHVDSSGVAWFSTGSSILRYDPSIKADKTYEAIFAPILRRVVSIDASQLLFGGTREPGRSAEAPIFGDLPFDQNALRFEFALPSYNDPVGNEFQYWLEGRDRGWSEWTKETVKNYTNLKEGTYRFHLRGRNAQGYISPASAFTFTVLPPWYRSGWAFAVYAVGLIGLGLFIQRHRRMIVENKRAKKQAQELVRERQVNERLHDLNKRLELANETLRQADRLKDEFLANTSHELRTPLTGILGCSAILREEVDDDHREFVNMIDENGQRLLNTLDSLLDLARLRAGLMELDFQEIDLAEKSRSIVQTYTSLAESKGIEVVVQVDGDVRGWFDDHCIECILNHLVGNAVKFTEAGGVRLELVDVGDRVVIRVRDTGVGIDEEFMPFLFDEFKQESTGLTRSHEGNGLGLAVTARIVDLIGGDIEVKSEKNVGTTFTVQLPLERNEPGTSRMGDGLPGEDLEVNAAEPGSDLTAA